ncbi:MAG: hypothetical protein OSA48_05410 [Akkermansiaceae bacterium]|nr:hypothetical protein [Akkermansiaceae bacterium]
MNREFDNLEEAELFACRMRSEGHVAEVMSESIPTLWGSAAIGKIRVTVYDVPDTEPEEQPTSPAADLFSRLFYGGIVGAFLVVIGWILLEVAAYLLKDGFMSAILKTVAAVSFIYALSAWSLLLSAFFRKGREAGSKLGLLVHVVISMVATVVSLSLLVLDFL